MCWKRSVYLTRPFDCSNNYIKLENNLRTFVFIFNNIRTVFSDGHANAYSPNKPMIEYILRKFLYVCSDFFVSLLYCWTELLYVNTKEYGEKFIIISYSSSIVLFEWECEVVTTSLSCQNLKGWFFHTFSKRKEEKKLCLNEHT